MTEIYKLVRLLLFAKLSLDLAAYAQPDTSRAETLSPAVCSVNPVNRSIETYSMKHHGRDLQILEISNFFPLSLAESWREEMFKTWEAKNFKNDEHGWRFASNNIGTTKKAGKKKKTFEKDGSQGDDNQKVRSLKNVKARLRKAKEMDKQNKFRFASLVANQRAF